MLGSCLVGTSYVPECHTVKKNDSSALVVTASLTGTGKLEFLLFNIIQKLIFQSVKHAALEFKLLFVSSFIFFCCLVINQLVISVGSYGLGSLSTAVSP